MQGMGLGEAAGTAEHATYGNVPRRAKTPGFSPANHSRNISASRRALSLWPDCRKCGSAARKSPSNKATLVYAIILAIL